MKLLIITDLHHWTDEEIEQTKNLSDYDICFLLGDIDTDKLKILKTIIKSDIYGLNGNHDLMDSIETAGIKNLNGKMIEFNGIKFAGIQGSHRYKKGPFCMYTHEESIEISNMIPKAHILLTHDTYYEGGQNSHHSGLKGITEYIKINKPALHIHGHLHNNEVKCIYFKDRFSIKDFFNKKSKTLSIGVYRAAIINTETFDIYTIY